MYIIKILMIPMCLSPADLSVRQWHINVPRPYQVLANPPNIVSLLPLFDEDAKDFSPDATVHYTKDDLIH